jgi:hypothetical protein
MGRQSICLTHGGWTDHGSRPAAEIFDGGDFVGPKKVSELGRFPGYHPASCSGMRGKLHDRSEQG